MSTPVLRATKSRALAIENLSTQEVAYVESRLVGNPPVVAARIAGMDDPAEDSVRLEKDLRVRAAIEASVKLNVYERQLTRDDVLAGFMDAVNMSQTATELVAAWREIGKVIGAYEPQKIELTARNKEQLQELNDSDLAKIAAIEGEYSLVDFDEDVEDAELIDPDA